MSLEVVAETPPLREDESGAMRVGGTRVLLELVIQAFQDGATPEVIAQRYSTLALSDIYSVIAYYLRHRDEVEAYLTRQETKANDVQRRTESFQTDLAEIRDRISARRSV